MRVVVNHLSFTKPISESVVAAAREGARLLQDAGGLEFRFVKAGEQEAFLVLAFPDAETEERVSAEVGGPWMREHIVPLLDGPPRRVSGELVD
jgi:hypothetical protein